MTPSSQHESDLRAANEYAQGRCGICLPDKPCNFEKCAEDAARIAFLAGAQHARAEERRRAERLVEAARFVLETLVPYSPISDEGIAMEKLRNALASYKREGGG